MSGCVLCSICWCHPCAGSSNICESCSRVRYKAGKYIPAALLRGMELYLEMPGRDEHDGFWITEFVSVAKALAKWCAVYGLGKLTATLIRKWITTEIWDRTGHSRLVLADFDLPADEGGFNNRLIPNVLQSMQHLAGKRLYKPTFTHHPKAQPTLTSYEKVTRNGWGR